MDFFYDGNRLITTIDAANRTEIKAFDSMGRVTLEVDGATHTTTYVCRTKL